MLSKKSTKGPLLAAVLSKKRHALGLALLLLWQPLLAGTIEGFKFNDLNANGVKDPGEPGLANQTISIRDNAEAKNGAGGLYTVQTNASGYFSSSGHNAGSFTLWSDIPTGWMQTTPVLGTGVQYYTVDLAQNQTLLVNVGIVDGSTIFTSCHDVTEIPKAQCDTLVALYDNTAGVNWTNNTGWKDSNTPCSWHGVTCASEVDDGTMVVTAVSPTTAVLNQSTIFTITGRNLPDSTAFWIGECDQLTALGGTPTQRQFQCLPRWTTGVKDGVVKDKSGGTVLKAFTVNVLPEGSALPNEPASPTDQVVQIDLRSNKLTGTLPPLSALTSLTQLYLHNNKLSGALQDLSALTSLTRIRLENNQLTGAIPSLNTFTNLTSLNISNNQLCQDSNANYAGWTEVDEFPSCDTVAICDTVTEMPKAQCDTLVALYDNTAGDNWTTNDGWLKNNSPCTWHGIICNGDGNVTNISLYSNQLSGTLPELSALTKLKYLSLYGNQLTGSVPELTALTQLEVLTVGNNQLSGSLPDLSALTQLKTLYLFENQLTGSIPALSALTQLERLRLEDNQFSGPIPDLTALTKLTDLRLSKNQLTGPIPDVSGAKNLQYLYLQYNNLSGTLPSWINTLTKLQRLYFNDNQLTGEIPALSNLTQLEYATFSSNQLTGAIPSLNTLSNLKSLNLSNNPLCQDTNANNYAGWTEVDKFPSCDTVAICDTVTEMPKAQCDTLVALYDNTAGDNWTNNTGWKQTNTPCSWQGITCANGKVVGIELNHNNLVGTLPDISALTELRLLRLADNQLSGTLPNFSVFTHLENVWLSHNQFTGTLPKLTGLTQLWHFHVWNNQLTGTIPDLSTLTNLQKLDLGKNQLSGTIPALKTLSQLQRLMLSYNQLTGAIPNLNGLTSLQELHLKDNQLCRNSEADYAGRTEVNEFPNCDDPNYGLVLLLPFDGNANDASGNGNDGTVNGATLTTDRFGNADSAYFFNGESSWIEATDSASLDSPVNAVSISVWVLVDNFPNPSEDLEGWNSIVSKGTAENTVVIDNKPVNEHRHYSLFVSGNKHIHFAHTPYNGSQTDFQLPLQKWVHIVVVANSDNGGQNLYYVNGKEVFRKTNIGFSTLRVNDDPLYIGKTLSSRFFHGKIDELLIYNRALTASEIQSLYNTSSPAQVKLVAETPAATVCVGRSFEATIKKQQFQTIDGVQLGLTFDKNTLKINRITNGNVLDSERQNEFNNTNGSLSFAADNAEGEAPSGEFDIMTVNITSLAVSTGTVLQFDTNNTFVTFGGMMLSHEADDLTIVIKDCSPGNAPPLQDNSSIATTAGQVGSQGDAGDGGPATAALLNAPKGLAINNGGNIYVADTQNHRIRKIDSQRNITTIAGNGNPGYSGDDGAATQAKLNSPMDVALDNTAQHLYIADRDNARIRKLDLTTGIITTVAGTNRKGYTGDNGPATAAKLHTPVAIALDGNNNIYIADAGRHRIRKVDNSTGIISTIAGKGSRGSRGDNGPATNAQLNQPSGLAVDKAGNLYITDTGNNRIRKIDNTGTISTVAGNGNTGYAGDNGPATAAKLNGPTDVTTDNAGNLYIADNNNHVIRKVDSNGNITTAIGNGNGNAGYSNDGTLATVTKLYNPSNVALDNNGNLLISDTNNHLIRQVGTATEDGPVAPTEGTTDCNTVTEIPTAECFALIAFNQSTGGDNWNNQDGWNTTNTPCSWNGITCFDGHVTGINLDGNNLTGPLPDLSALSELTTLNLSHNQLSGPMAPITALPKLQTLQLEQNNLQGVIPDLSGLTQLQTLALSDNDQVCRDTNINYGPINLDDVKACPTENILPTAAFTATPTAGQAPLTVQLDGSASTDPYGTIASYHWTISDGRTFTSVSPTITFDNSGDYEITLMVFDNEDYHSINDSKKTITVTAAADKSPLTLAKDGEGIGRVVIKQGSEVERCQSDCPTYRKDFSVNSEVKLTATAENGSTFTNWSGDCTGTERRISLTMDSPKQCTVHFELDVPAPSGLYTLTVNTVGTLGSTGTIEIDDENCGSECVGNYRANQRVKLTAVPNPHAYFAGWSRDCKTEAQDPTITVTMTADKHCTAVFGNDADVAAEQITEDFLQEGELSTGEELTKVYPPNLNEERLIEACRLTEKPMLVVEEHMLINQTWPTQFHGIEWYEPLPDTFYTKSIQIISGGTEIELESETVFVEGDYIKVEVELVTNTGVEEILPILVYYEEVPKITESNLRRRRSPRIGRYKRCRRHHRRHCR
jgi:Leucine-rich repeat (LRR) protein